jgi:DNA-binding PadR family transcriptional regulator
MTANISLEEILDQLMLEEPKPSYEALLRWIERYPKYRQELTDFFAIWGVQSYLPPADIDEDAIVQKGVDHAMAILRKQGRILSKEEIEAPLQPLDQLVLAAIYMLHGQGYSVNITEKVSEMSGKHVLLASVFGALSRLERRYFVSAWRPETEHDGAARRYFAITIAGERALAHARETSQVLDRLLGDFA